MVEYKLNPDDIDFLHTEFPRLDYIEGSPGKISGILDFGGYYDPTENRFHLGKDRSLWANPAYFEDSYEIEIGLQSGLHSDLPQVVETGCRIRDFAKSCEPEIELEDLHINKKNDMTACLCVSIEEKDLFPSGFNLKFFMMNLVVPFFYSQSYFQKYRKWPLPTYGHGITGLLEAYYEKEVVTLEDTESCVERLSRTIAGKRLLNENSIGSHLECTCGSGKIFRNCHPMAARGLRKLREEINRQ